MANKKVVEIELSEREEHLLVRLIKKFLWKISPWHKEPERVRKVVIKKTPLGKWKELTEIIDTIITGPLPKILKQKGIEDIDAYIADMEPMDLLKLIPDIMAFAIDEVAKLIQAGTGLDKEFIEKHVGPEDALNIIMAIIEVNNISMVAEKGKNVFSLLGLGKMMAPMMNMKTQKQTSRN